MSDAVLKVVQPLQAGRVRVLIYAEDPKIVAALRKLIEQAGHEVVDAPHAGFAAATDTEPRALLTPREIEVLGAIGEGLTNKAIARRLDISLHTVKFHVESLFRKLGARTRTEALAKAAERQLDV
jgi:DNA-binding NarL/FixJ family response regulator